MEVGEGRDPQIPQAQADRHRQGNEQERVEQTEGHGPPSRNATQLGKGDLGPPGLGRVGRDQEEDEPAQQEQLGHDDDDRGQQLVLDLRRLRQHANDGAGAAWGEALRIAQQLGGERRYVRQPDPSQVQTPVDSAGGADIGGLGLDGLQRREDGVQAPDKVTGRSRAGEGGEVRATGPVVPGRVKRCVDAGDRDAYAVDEQGCTDAPVLRPGGGGADHHRPGFDGALPLDHADVRADTIAVDQRRGVAGDPRGARDCAHLQRGHRGFEQPGEGGKPVEASGADPLDQSKRLLLHRHGELDSHDASGGQRLVEGVAKDGLAGGPEEEGPGHRTAHDERGEDEHGQRQSPPEPHASQHEAEISHGGHLTTDYGSPPLQPPRGRMVS